MRHSTRLKNKPQTNDPQFLLDRGLDEMQIEIEIEIRILISSFAIGKK